MVKDAKLIALELNLDGIVLLLALMEDLTVLPNVNTVPPHGLSISPSNVMTTMQQ